MPVKFWKTKTWKREFFKQLALANKLIDAFDPAAVSKALRTPKGKTVYSFAAPFFKHLVELEQATLDRQLELQSNVAVAIPPPSDTRLRPVFVPKESILSKLKGL